METPERSQTARSETEPKRLEYRSPSLARLGKLAELTLATAAHGMGDAAMPPDRTG